MLAGIKFTDYVPTSLVGVNSASATLAAEVVTGLPIGTGARPGPGEAFYLSEKWANQLSATAINGATVLTCHAGWYMVAQVDVGATANLIAQGYIGARTGLTYLGNPSTGVVTDVVNATTALGAGQNPVIFLNAVTPGNYTIVQLSGDATVYGSAAITKGAALAYSTTLATVATSAAPTTYAILQTLVGLAQTTTTGAGLVRVNAAFPFGYI
jgi:hypothetical protein